MSVLSRHNIILEMLMKADKPLSGSYLAENLGVSRQIIVQDMNQLKADGHAIISTARGYILDPTQNIEKIFKVYHTVEDTQKELELIVDLGATVKDVFIYHRVYGEIHAKLGICSRKDASDFCTDIMSGKSSPLMTATAGYHYHTVAARDEHTLMMVERALKENGFLAELTDYEPEKLSKQK